MKKIHKIIIDHAEQTKTVITDFETSKEEQKKIESDKNREFESGYEIGFKDACDYLLKENIVILRHLLKDDYINKIKELKNKIGE
jgi:hypothetical protein